MVPSCQVLVVCICSYVDVSAFKDRNSLGEEHFILRLSKFMCLKKKDVFGHLLNTNCNALSASYVFFHAFNYKTYVLGK